MTLTEPGCAGKGELSDVHYLQTSLTSPHVSTARNMSARNNMNQKELEDRLAAAEALSSLGFAGSFVESSLASQVSSESNSASAKDVEAKGGGRGRGRRKGEKGVGRHTKNRSTRGRGRGKAKHHVGGTPITGALAPADSVYTDSLHIGSVPLPVAAAETTVTPSGARNRGRGRGRGGGGGGRQGNNLTSPVVQDDARLRYPENSGSRDLAVTLQSVTPTIRHVPHTLGVAGSGNIALLGGGSQQIVPMGNVQFTNTVAFVSSSASSTLVIGTGERFASNSSVSSSKVSSSASAFSSATASTVIPLSSATAATTFLSSPSPNQTLTSTLSNNVPSSTPSSRDTLPSQLNLTSLRSDTLPSFSLGSTGLPNLPSIPNLPSLPIASLQLDSVVSGLPVIGSQDVGMSSQVSPQNRDTGEKSLPLKKRKIVDSSSSVSPPSLPKTSPGVQTQSTSSSTETTASAVAVASPEKPVSSPVPVLPMLSQMLPPPMYMQLLTEIDTAITPDEDGDIPLHIAVVHENEAMVKKLIQLMALAGQKVDRYNKQHQTPLHLAVKLASLSAIEMLLAAEADPNLVDSVGLTSTHMAVQGRDVDCLEALLQWGRFPCDLNYRNFEGLAPLHTAVMNNDLEIVSRLLENGADVNIMDGKSGRTVLFHAAETNQKAAVELLLNRGADPDIANYAGVMPAMAAQGRSHTTVARMLARAQDGVTEDEKGVDKDKDEARKSPDLNQAPVALEIMITEGGSPRLPIQEVGSRVTPGGKTPIKPYIVCANNGGPAQAVSAVSTTQQPSILQSSSMAAAHALGVHLPRNVVTLQGKGTETASATKRQHPGSIIKATHHLPGVITKMTSSLAAPNSVGSSRVTALPRRSSVSSCPVDSAAADVKCGKSNTMPFSQTVASVPLGLIKSVTRDGRKPDVESESSKEGAGGGKCVLKREAPTEDCENGGQDGMRFALAPTQEALKVIVMQNIMKAAAERQNGGQTSRVNLPLLPGVFPLSPTISAAAVVSENPASCGADSVLQSVSVRSVTRVTPHPDPASSALMSPALGQVGLPPLPSSVTPSPSAAHLQPTRPLLVFRSSSVDPGSGNGGRMESVEVRHVTTDALLALQQSSTNSVNPANHTLKSASSGFHQQVHNFLPTRPGEVSSGIPMEMERGPPISNHVTREGISNHSYGFNLDSYSDEPKDLSLKTKNKQNSDQRVPSGVPEHIKTEPIISPVYYPEKLSPTDRSDLKRKIIGSHQVSSNATPRKVSKIKSSKTSSKESKKVGMNRKTEVMCSFSADKSKAEINSEETSRPTEGQTVSAWITNVREMKGEESSLMKTEGRTISISESGLIMSEPDLDVSSPVYDVVQSQAMDRQPDRSVPFIVYKNTSDVLEEKPALVVDLQSSPPSTSYRNEQTLSNVGEKKQCREDVGDSFQPYVMDQCDKNDHTEHVGDTNRVERGDSAGKDSPTSLASPKAAST